MQSIAGALAHRARKVTLWSPHSLQMQPGLRDAVAGCLASAFATGVWAQSPMPMGDAAVPHSARGIVAQLGGQAKTLIVSAAANRRTAHRQTVLACVIGSILDENLIRSYQIARFGARHGDALLAYIGLAPDAQGSRAFPLNAQEYLLSSDRTSAPQEQKGQSLAGLLFARWLELPAIERCPRVFVRTREVLHPIQHLAKKNRFQFCGKFELDFQGERQDRMIFKRFNA